jgi:hypothetical protein
MMAGSLARCTYIQRLNPLGGVAPRGLFTLPAWNGIPNFELAVPYQVLHNRCYFLPSLFLYPGKECFVYVRN